MENIIEKVIEVLRLMGSEDFRSLVRDLDEEDIWKNDHYDVFNNISDRMNVVDTFEDSDYIRYYDKLIERGLI